MKVFGVIPTFVPLDLVAVDYVAALAVVMCASNLPDSVPLRRDDQVGLEDAVLNVPLLASVLRITRSIDLTESVIKCSVEIT